MSFLQIEINCDENPELKAKLEADGSARLKEFANKAQQFVSKMCDESLNEVYEKACKEDRAMMAALRGVHDPDGKELLTRVTKEELFEVFGAGYAAGHRAGKKRKCMEELIVDELNKHLGDKACTMNSAAEQEKPRAWCSGPCGQCAQRAEKQQKVEKEEEEDEAQVQKRGGDADANLPYRNAVAYIGADGEEEEPKYEPQRVRSRRT